MRIGSKIKKVLGFRIRKCFELVIKEDLTI
jgi:hypothetical protein